jgi:hypothetical protein
VREVLGSNAVDGTAKERYGLRLDSDLVAT